MLDQNMYSQAAMQYFSAKTCPHRQAASPRSIPNFVPRNGQKLDWDDLLEVDTTYKTLLILTPEALMIISLH